MTPEKQMTKNRQIEILDFQYNYDRITMFTVFDWQ